GFRERISESEADLADTPRDIDRRSRGGWVWPRAVRAGLFQSHQSRRGLLRQLCGPPDHRLHGSLDDLRRAIDDRSAAPARVDSVLERDDAKIADLDFSFAD